MKKHYSTSLALSLLLLGNSTLKAQNVIPLPNHYNQTKGDFTLPATVSFDHTNWKELSTSLVKVNGIKTAFSKTPTVRFKESKTLSKEAYTLQVTQEGITITASSPSGRFYAIQTLSQLIQNKGEKLTIPCCEIKDAPRFGWRGMMLDESRHFYGKKTVKHVLDTMAAHKMNKFHWHLTDNEGWRIEIKSYPKLTEIGAWRGEGCKLPTPARNMKVKGVNNPKYGGFYTQEDIKEIVAYAAKRHIEIIPEIDVPGHGLAICASYPEVLPKSKEDEGTDVHGIKGNVLSVVREENYVMLDKIFGEIAALFPTSYIHVGGDEVNQNAWAKSPEHLAFMKKNGMKHVGQLQNHFMLRLEKILKKHGKTLMGWNEIMHGGDLSSDTAVMAWISVDAGLHAARKGHPTIMTPGPHTYFDMKYPGHSETGHWWAGIVDTKNAYNWNPVFANQLKPTEQKFVKGVHCCLWTEFVKTPEDVDYKFWPRACATAEVGWTQQSKRQWAGFDKRLGKHLNYLDKLEVLYRVRPPSAELSRGKITIKPAHGSGTTVYTLDGTEPTSNSPLYQGQSFKQSALSKLRYRTLRADGRMSKIEKGARRLPVGNWTKSDLVSNTSKTLKFPVSLDKPGLWFAEIKCQRGKEGITLEHVALLKDGKTWTPHMQKFNSSLARGHSQRVKFQVSSFDASAKYELALTIRQKGRNDSKGEIIFDRSPFLEPNATATTKVPSYGSNKIENLVDYNESTVFWSGRSGKKGDTWNIIFTKPVLASQITVPSGKVGTNNDIIKKGVLEYSTDGKTFQGEVPFQLGPATLKFSKPTKVKALRVRLTANQDEWTIIRDPQVK